MNTKAPLKEFAIMVNDSLTDYVAVHDKIFKEGATFKSVLKNLIGIGFPMRDLFEMAEQLVPLWASIAVRIESFRINYHSYCTEDEEIYLNILIRYVAAVQRTIDALVARQRLAVEGSEGGPKNPMTWTTYKQKDAEYQAAVEEYLAIGRELNAKLSTIL